MLATGCCCQSTSVVTALLQVLDAPALQDDFYLNLVDWSSQNMLAVGLGPCVYLWSACTSKVRETSIKAGQIQGSLTCML